MRSQVLFLLVLASLVSAGCAFPFRDNGARAMPQLIAPKPGCAKLTIDVNPATIGPGQTMTVHANVTNVCADAFQVMARNGCEVDGLDMQLTNGYRIWKQHGSDMTEGRACPSTWGAVKTLEQGQGVNATFVWDGTLTDQGCASGNGFGCGKHYAAPAGTYTLTVTLDDTFATASQQVTYNP